MSADPLTAFTAALAARDIIVPRNLITDGRLHRCDAAGRHGKNDAAYLLHLDDFPAGGFENHRDGLGWQDWYAKGTREFTPVERAEYRRRMAEARAQCEADRRQRQADAADRAAGLWRSADPECNGHPYLEAKHIGAHGARLYRDTLLVVPVRDLDGAITSLQFIDQAGTKRFLTGGRKREGCCVIGKLTDAAIIVVTEGFATAATLHEATDYPVVIAFDAGNLPPVAAAVRQRFPQARIIIAADDDHQTAGNPGLTKAREAAGLAAAAVAIPDFGPDRPPKFTDFNDLGFFASHDRVREIIDQALGTGVSPAPRWNLLINIVDPTTLADVPVPPRQWLVPDWVPQRRATALYGAGGEGKTLIAQQLATACAIGERWLGLSIVKCNSLQLYCEDDLEEMHRRQDEINAHYGCTFDALGAMRWLPRLGDDNMLMSFDTGRPRLTPLFDELVETAKEHNAKLVIIDTLADVFAGHENDRTQARAFAQQALGYLAREIGGAVIALAHPSRAGMNSGSGDSGSTAWVGTFRSQLHLSTPRPDEDSEPSDPDLRVLTRRKSNNARRGDEIELRWRDGVLVPTRDTSGILGWIERKSAKRVFLELLDKVTAEGRYVAESSRSPNYAPMLFARRPDRERFRQGDFKRAMEELFVEGAIKIGTCKGGGRHERECIVRAPS